MAKVMTDDKTKGAKIVAGLMVKGARKVALEAEEFLAKTIS